MPSCARATARSGRARSAAARADSRTATSRTYNTTNGLASNTVASILEGADGTIWFGTPNGVSTFSRGGWRRYRPPTACRRTRSTRCSRIGGELWVGTAAGIAVFEGGQLRADSRRCRPPLRQSILGIAEDRSRLRCGSHTADRVLRVNRDGAAARRPWRTADVREYGLADGLLASKGVKRHRSVVADPRGRVWFSMTSRAVDGGSGWS